MSTIINHIKLFLLAFAIWEIKICYLARLPFVVGGPRCLSFWYHMYGSDMGTLSVSRNGTQLWTKTGDQGNTWHWVQMNVGTSSQTFKVLQVLHLNSFLEIRKCSDKNFNKWLNGMAVYSVFFQSYYCKD